jgi:hypothetical protein
MPTISRERIPFPQKDGSTEFVREIKVSAVGTFTIDLPADVVEALDVETLYAQTKTDVLKKWDETIAKFRQKKAVTKKIIAYRFALWGNVAARNPKDDGRNPLRWGDTAVSHFDRRPGLGLALEVSVFNETTVTDEKGRAGCRYEEVPSTIQDSARLCVSELNRRGDELAARWRTQLPWTAEREAFFVRIVAGLENLLLELHDAFGEKKNVLDLVDGKRQLLRLK